MNRHAVLVLAWLLIPPTIATDAIAAEFYLFADGGIAEPDLGTLERHQQRHVARRIGSDAASSARIDDRSGAAIVGVGVRPFRYLALELGYYYLGDYRLERRARIDTAAHRLSTGTTSDVDISGWGLSGRFLFPIAGALYATATLGVARLDADITTVTTTRQDGLSEGAIMHRERDEHESQDTVGILGVGARYRFGPHFGLRVDYRYLGGFDGEQNGGEEDLDLLTAGLIYVF